MVIKKLSDKDISKCKQLCNFTDMEMQYFNLKLKNYSNVQISLDMNISESQVSKLANRVKSKILRIL